MNTETKTQKIWLLPTGVIATLVIFATVFFIYADGARGHHPSGFFPFIVAIVLFAGTMLFLTDQVVAKEGNRRIGLSILIVVGETILFTYAFMFLILNIFGS